MRAHARAQAEELKLARKEREDLGVELYTVQQGLAKLQMQLEKTHENHNLISQMRERAELELANARNDHVGSLKDVKTYRSKYDKYKVRARGCANQPVGSVAPDYGDRDAKCSRAEPAAG